MNWRKPILWSLLQLTGSGIPKRYQEAVSLCGRGPDAVRQTRERRLSELLSFAARHVPYYRTVLREAGVVGPGEQVDLDRFPEVPFLTKEILLSRFEDLKADDLDLRRWYRNTSGGSTGEPVVFLQDRAYQASDVAATLFFFHMAGKEMGESEVKLWGSERDIFEGRLGRKERIQNWLYNRILMNSFRMGEEEMRAYCGRWNRARPRVVWSYVDSVFELARYVEANGVRLRPPAAIVVTAGTLQEDMRHYIERTLHTVVLNEYGSREAGVLACECPGKHGLHVFEWKTWVEIVDRDGCQCPPGEEGEIVVTNLTNYAMPLIRFQIGDRGVMGAEAPSCKFPLRVLEKVTGRVTNHFVLRDGRLIHGEYFTHLFYFRPWVRRFQVVQVAFDHVKCVVVEGGSRIPEDMQEIEAKIRLVMGKDCRVEFEFVEDIPRLASGKYLYTRSEISPVGRVAGQPGMFHPVGPR